MYTPFTSVQEFVDSLELAYTKDSRKDKITINERLVRTPILLAHTCLILLKNLPNADTTSSNIYLNLVTTIDEEKTKLYYLRRYVYLLHFANRDNGPDTVSYLNEATGEIEYVIHLDDERTYKDGLFKTYELEHEQIKKVSEIFDETMNIEKEFVDMAINTNSVDTPKKLFI